ncbi:MAG TPA: glycosyltransferase family 4 protein [Thermohalobaculum sp.]|nr:glycosyltransferase family 4 protein [Thermohalobaculum sp.]
MNDATTIPSLQPRRLDQTGHGPANPRIIAINRFYWPDSSATSQLLTDLMESLAAEGWPDVTVVTSRMLYHDSTERLAPSAEHGGVRIRRVWTSRHLWHRLRGRMLEYLTFYGSAFAALLIEARRGDVILVTTDPPLFSVLARLAVGLKGARMVTWNHDLYPEVAKVLGVPLAAGALGRMLRGLRNGVLRAASDNIVISPAMAECVRGELGSLDRVSIIRNWCGTEIYPVAPAENPLREDWGLGDDFVIGYSGNLGRAHIPDKVAELVRRTQDIPGVRWLFIGGGVGLNQIRALAASAPTGTIQVRPHQNRGDLAHSLSVPDLHLVSLDPACEGLIFPSKIYGILAAGRATLFLGNPTSEIGVDLVQHRIGVTLDPDRPELWRDAILALRADPDGLAAMGARARARHEVLTRLPVLTAWASRLAKAAPICARPAARSTKGG